MANDIVCSRGAKDVGELEWREDEAALDLDDAEDTRSDDTDSDPLDDYDESGEVVLRRRDYDPEAEIEQSASRPGATHGGGW